MDQIYPQKVFPVENRKSEHYDWILHIQISRCTKFQLKLIILIFFYNQIYLKKVFPVKNSRSDYHHWILHTWISLVTKFLLQLNTDFWTKFAQKRYFWSKTEKLLFGVRLRLLLTILNFSAWEPTDKKVFKYLFSF